MAFFHNSLGKVLHKSSQKNSGIDLSIQSNQPVVLKTSSSPLPAKPKTLAELEKEMEAEAQNLRPHKVTLPTAKAKRGIINKIITAAILVGVPVSVVWIANLPYSVIRRPVARTAPLLLLPSYMSMDSHYRQAIASVEQADQLIDNVTSPADLDLGEQKVKETQKHLDALPVWFLDDWPQYTYWFGWRFSLYEVQTARARVGQLEAKVFQEKNAQTLFMQGENALNAAKQQYQQVLTPVDKQAAIVAWQAAIDQLEQLPSQTLAEKTAQKKLDAYKRDFREVVGLAADNERISTLIEAARQFSWQAAKVGQNPPYNVAKWEQIANLWQLAIDRLEAVPAQDLAGYAEAQKLLATYEANLGEVKIRQQAEQESVDALEQAQRQIESLLASNTKYVERSLMVSQLQSIITQLEKVQNGTTAYLKAQDILLSAHSRLKQLQPK